MHCPAQNLARYSSVLPMTTSCLIIIAAPLAMTLLPSGFLLL